jgi:sugar O-acyltransferase (sialic acid O-acetyltransferase NeuD family)
MSDIVIFGAGQIAEVATAYIDRHGPDRVVGFTVDRSHAKSETLHGRPIIPWEDLERRFPPGSVKLLGPLSYQRLNDFRRERHLEGKSRGYGFASFIHPQSHVYAEAIGENCFILENNVIQPFARIGDGVIIWSGSHIGHHAVVEDFCFLSSQVGLGGGAHIGAGSFLAGKAGVESGVAIGAACFIGTGAIVRKALPDGSVMPGPDFPVAPYPSARLKRLRFR